MLALCSLPVNYVFNLIWATQQRDGLRETECPRTGRGPEIRQRRLARLCAATRDRLLAKRNRWLPEPANRQPFNNSFTTVLK